MVEINLLPWRQQARLYQRKMTKIFIFVSVVLPMLILTGIHFILAQWVVDAGFRVSHLAAEITAIKQAMLPQQDDLFTATIRKMFADRDTSVQLFTELDSVKMNEVCFTEITRKNQVVTFSGYARSINELTEFLKNWPIASLFSQIRLMDLHYQSGDRRTDFRFYGEEMVKHEI